MGTRRPVACASRKRDEGVASPKNEAYCPSRSDYVFGIRSSIESLSVLMSEKSHVDR